jgi:hypothetical protein
MHMLRDEENAKYRQLIKNTLEFDPQILKRHVNFMSNPDEETAIDQFGIGDKYFGVCTVMATLPGLPMFAHGQMDGLRERYGMEYRRAKMEEQPDEEVLGEHERSVFPLLRDRRLFAEVQHFHLFDLEGRGGRINENVFAYSNHRARNRSLVLYNNQKTKASGWVRKASPIREKRSGRLVRRSLAEALGLPRSGYAIFRDHVTGLEYIRECAELWEKGLRVELGGYQRQVLMDWRIVRGKEWEAVCEALKGAGVESVDGMRGIPATRVAGTGDGRLNRPRGGG